VLAHLDTAADLDRQGHDLSRRIVAERYMSLAARLDHHQRHAREHPAPAAPELHGVDAHPVVAKQQGVMHEEDGFAAVEGHIRHRDHGPLDLAGGLAELDPGHVLDRGKLGPS